MNGAEVSAVLAIAAGSGVGAVLRYLIARAMGPGVVPVRTSFAVTGAGGIVCGAFATWSMIGLAESGTPIVAIGVVAMLAAFSAAAIIQGPAGSANARRLAAATAHIGLGVIAAFAGAVLTYWLTRS